jgi:hypothetical protein
VRYAINAPASSKRARDWRLRCRDWNRFTEAKVVREVLKATCRLSHRERTDAGPSAGRRAPHQGPEKGVKRLEGSIDSPSSSKTAAYSLRS